MVVGTCGFGSTGSSVITDYLKEYKNICVLDGIEFTWVSTTDGLIDLAYHVLNPHSRTSDSSIAIKRYYDLMEKVIPYYYNSGNLLPETFRASTKKFIESITDVKWKGFIHESKMGYWEKKIKVSLLQRRIIPILERKKGYRVDMFPKKDFYLSVNPSNFYEVAKLHIKELLVGMGADFNKMIVLDQPFPGNNPQACFPFFENPYAIVVDRDPRDNYVFAKTKLMGRNYFMATDSVEDFVKYYKAIRKEQPYLNNDNRVLFLQFEDMIYDYENTTEKLRCFLNLPENPNPKSIFDPKLSINNTQVFKRFPEYAKDIQYIEEQLTEYLYNFDKYGEIKISGEMFFGKSPLNKKENKG